MADIFSQAPMACKELVLHSPANGDPCVYYWPMDEKSKGDGALEVIETIRWVCHDFPEMKPALDNHILADCDPTSYESMKTVCDRYNRVIDSVRQMRAGTSLAVAQPKRPTVGLLRHIIHKAYNHAVIEPEKLNDYEPFSPEVYGETSFEFISQMIEQIPITENDIFIDLGSGVGQVVLQMAASTKAKKCIGIEKADVPASYAKQLEKSFKFWMRWYGKKYSEYELVKGDFFDEAYKDIINNATFIFVNNFAFGPTVDHMLKIRFADLRDGAKIVSSKSFCPLNFRITDRNLSDIGTIMHVLEIQPNIKGSVSWTGKPVSYYHHTIDRRKLENYFLNMRNPKNKNNDENSKSRRSAKNDNSSNSSDSNSDDSKDSKSKDESYFGPTTRKAWSEWCNSRYRDINSNSNQSSTTANTQSTFETGYHSDGSKQQSQNSLSSSRPGRLQKYSPGVSAVVRRAAKNKSRGRRPGRPRKEGLKHIKSKNCVSLDSLDLLHAQTVLSITNNAGIRTEPAPGCVDQSLSTVGKTDSDSSHVTKHVDASQTMANEQKYEQLLNDELIDLQPEQSSRNISDCNKFGANDQKITTENVASSKQTITPRKPDPTFIKSVSVALDTLFEGFKQQYLSYILYLHTPDAKMTLEQQIEEENRRSAMLSSQIDILERNINTLLQRGVFLLKSRLSELNIVASNSEELVNKAKEIVVRNKELQEQVNSFQEQVNYLDNVNVILCKNKSVEALLGMMNPPKSNEKDCNDKLYKELSNALVRRKSLVNAVEQLDDSVNRLEKVNHIQRPSSVDDTPPMVFPESQKCNIDKFNPNLAYFNSNESSTVTDSPQRVITIEEKMKKMIVAALNEKPVVPNPTISDDKSNKKESRKRSISKTDPPPKPNKFFHRNNKERVSIVGAAKVSEDSAPPSSKINSKLSEYDFYHLSNNKDHISSTPKEKFVCSPTQKSDSKTNSKLSSRSSFTNSTGSEDKRPILLTFKIDRRDNSAIVTSPAISPEKSPKLPKDSESISKRKNSSPESGKKSRSPKYSAIVPETNDAEKRTSLIIKLNHSQINNVSSQASEISENYDLSNNEKPFEASNSKSSHSSRSYHDGVNGTHKWQTTISNSFDKLVKLAHQLEPLREETEKSDSEASHKSLPRKKRSSKSVAEPTKAPSDTPPRTPSPSISPERPLTPSTPPGFTPLPVTTIAPRLEDKKGENDVQAGISNERVETPCSTSTETGSTADSLEDLKIRKVSRPPKKNVQNGAWLDSNDHFNQSAINISSAMYNTLNVLRERPEIVKIKKAIPVAPYPVGDLSVVQPVNGCNPPQNNHCYYDTHPHIVQYPQNHTVIHSNQNTELSSKPNAKPFPFAPQYNGQVSPSSVPISTIAPSANPMLQDQRLYGPSSINFSSYNAFNPYAEANFKHQRKVISESDSFISKCYSQKKLIRPSRLDGVCKRDFNTPLKQFT